MNPGNPEAKVRRTGKGEGFVWAEMGNGALIYSCYISPNRPIRLFAEYLENIQRSVNSTRGTNHQAPVLICGDFNAGAPDWGAEAYDERGTDLVDWMARNGWEVSNEGGVPTFCRCREIGGIPVTEASYLDLTITTEGSRGRVTGWRVWGDVESRSDHRYVSSMLDIPNGRELGQPQRPAPTPQQLQPCYQWRKMNLEKFEEELGKGCGETQRDERNMARVLLEAC